MRVSMYGLVSSSSVEEVLEIVGERLVSGVRPWRVNARRARGLGDRLRCPCGSRSRTSLLASRESFREVTRGLRPRGRDANACWPGYHSTTQYGRTRAAGPAHVVSAGGRAAAGAIKSGCRRRRSARACRRAAVITDARSRHDARRAARPGRGIGGGPDTLAGKQKPAAGSGAVPSPVTGSGAVDGVANRRRTRQSPLSARPMASA